MKRIVSLAALVVAVITPGALHGSDARTAAGPVDEVLIAERAWAKAAVDGDVSTFSGYMADDYQELFVNPAKGGRKSSWGSTAKATWVDNLRSKREKYDSVVLRNLKVYFHDDVATVTGEYTQKGTSSGKDIGSSGLYADTWVRRDGRWRLISSVFP